ncbi:MAG: ComEC/Rec2 family competence protein [Rhizobiaceae bacterium]|nr:ComEC/Rec2 family competence protein [Rhizobiaceae bacterium]
MALKPIAATLPDYERDAFEHPAPADLRPVQIDFGQTDGQKDAFERAHSAINELKSLSDLEQERGTVSLLAPVAIGVGALIYYRLGFEPGWLPLLLWLSVLLAFAVRAWGKPALRTVLLGLALAAGGASLAKLEVTLASTKMLGSEVSTTLSGKVVDIDHLANGRIRLLIDVQSTQQPALRYQPDRVRVSAGRLPSGIKAGSSIKGRVKLHPPSGPTRPGGYDFSFDSYFAGIGANGYFLAVPQMLTEQDAATFRTTIDNVRNALAARIRSAIGGPEGEIAAALIVGVRAGIPEEVNESLRRTGLAHILSISGLHMALVAGIAMGAIRCAFALLPGFSSRRPVKKFASVGALAVLTAYVLISGAEIAAMRSYLMIAIMLLATLLDRRALSMRNLALAAVAVLVVTPHEIVGPSFQMSFAATAALIGGYSIWTASGWSGGVQPRERSIVARIAAAAVTAVLGTIITALVAGAATSIYGAWHFQRVSPLSLVANLLVSPIVSLVVMPFAVLGMIAMPFGLDGLMFSIMGQGLSIMLKTSDWLSEQSPLDAVGEISGYAVIWFTAALLVAVLPTTRIRWAALPMAVVGGILLATSPQTDVLVSEDARLVAIKGADGQLLINRRQTGGFTIEGWEKAMATDEVVPAKSINDREDTLLANISNQRFVCSKGVCAVEHATGAIIVFSSENRVSDELCAIADLVVLQVPAKGAPCDGVTFIDAQLLARNGAASVQIGENLEPLKVYYAINEPFRPWHRQRGYSRAARGFEDRRKSE